MTNVKDLHLPKKYTKEEHVMVIPQTIPIRLSHHPNIIFWYHQVWIFKAPEISSYVSKNCHVLIIIFIFNQQKSVTKRTKIMEAVATSIWGRALLVALFLYINDLWKYDTTSLLSFSFLFFHFGWWWFRRYLGVKGTQGDKTCIWKVGCLSMAYGFC